MYRQCIESLEPAKRFRTLDAYLEYCQVHIQKADRPKTAFVRHAGTYHCIPLTFGFKNVSASVQLALDVVLIKCKWKTCLFYIEDMIINLNTIEEHIVYVHDILTNLKHAGITLREKELQVLRSRCRISLRHYQARETRELSRSDWVSTETNPINEQIEIIILFRIMQLLQSSCQ